MQTRITLATLFFSIATACLPAGAIEAVVEVEEDVYFFASPNNGSGPMWSYGCTVVARMGDDVFVSQMETGADVPLLCNTRWLLLRRTDAGWKTIAEADGYRQREPCPLAALPERDIVMYVNDSIEPPGVKYGTCNPHLIRFTLGDDAVQQTALQPKWGSETYYTDHSYRGYAADSTARQLLMLNIDAKTSIQHACLLSDAGETLATGSITFPVRSCYPQVALRNGAVHVLAIGDIVEPVEEWRKYKHEQTRQDWDYVFRILYHVTTPDLRVQDFGAPLEIANVDATGGAISNQDLWIAPDGAAHIVYTEREVASALMRDKFFPGKSIINSLHLAVVRDGVVVSRRELIHGREGAEPGLARLHETPDGAVYAVVYMTGPEAGNKLLKVYPEPGPTLVPIPLKKPVGSYALASVRAGNQPSNTIDLFGQSSADTMSYARITLK